MSEPILAAKPSAASSSVWRPRLRRDLIVWPQVDSDRVVVEDPLRHQFFRLGRGEYALAAACDGRRTLGELLALSQSVSEGDPAAPPDWTRERLSRLLGWLASAGLLENPPRADATPPGPATSSAPGDYWLLSGRRALASPQRLLERLTPLAGWLFQPVLSLVLVVLALAAVGPVLADRQTLVDHLARLSVPHAQAALFACWLGLKIVHELAHGLVCLRYGGQVPEAGVTFVLLAPIPYLDASSSWRFASRGERMHVTLAGVYVELLAAGLAALVWQTADAPLVRVVALDVVFLGTWASWLFNLNPLLRFDGYYLLADWLAIDNLSTQSGQWLRAKFAWLSGGQPLGVTLPPRHANLIRTYAVASGMWRVVVLVGILAALATWFHGLGLALVAAWGLSRLRGWLATRWSTAALARPAPPRHWRRPALAASILVGLSACGMVAAGSWPRLVPAIVEFAPGTVLRAEAPGFVRAIHVADGEAVRAGQLLFELENDELDERARYLASACDEARARLRRWAPKRLRDRAARVEYEVAASELRVWEGRLAEAERQQQALRITAPTAGRVLRRNLDALVGTYLAVGDEIAVVGDPGAKQLSVLLPVADADALNPTATHSVTVTVAGLGTWPARIERVEPRASRELPDPSLAASHGGEVAVRRTKDGGEESLAPARVAIVPLDSLSSSRFWVGQHATVRLARPLATFPQRVARWTGTQWSELWSRAD